MTPDSPVPVSADAATRERRDEWNAQRDRIRKNFPSLSREPRSALGSILAQADALAAQVEALEAERSVLAAKIQAVERELDSIGYRANTEKVSMDASFELKHAIRAIRAAFATEEGP